MKISITCPMITRKDPTYLPFTTPNARPYRKIAPKPKSTFYGKRRRPPKQGFWGSQSICYAIIGIQQYLTRHNN
jgi:hypothetical protein